MPIKKAGIKALRQDAKRASRHSKAKSDIDALVRRVRKSIEAKDTSKAQEWLTAAIKRIDKAAQKGSLKKNTAARKKSRLVKLVKSVTK